MGAFSASMMALRKSVENMSDFLGSHADAAINHFNRNLPAFLNYRSLDSYLAGLSIKFDRIFEHIPKNLLQPDGVASYQGLILRQSQGQRNLLLVEFESHGRDGFFQYSMDIRPIHVQQKFAMGYAGD